MFRSLLLLVLVFLCCESSFSQTPTSPCPTITVTAPSGITAPGEFGRFTATVDPPNNKLGYTWSLDGSAVIVAGQGSTDLQFQMREFDGSGYDPTVKATLNIKGLPPGCPDSVSETYAYTIDPGLRR